MPISEENKKLLREKGREDLIEVMEINDSGYAGCMPDGQIVDRRKHPEAIPVQKNRLLGIPEPKPLPGESFERVPQKLKPVIGTVNEGFVKKGKPRHVVKLPGRNEPCTCGSGLKYKKCHGKKFGNDGLAIN